MAYKLSRRTGRYWDDVIQLDKVINKFNFITTGSKERDFENGLASALTFNEDLFNATVISQTNKVTKVESVRCFGKNHRPDMTLDTDGIAIELKFTDYSGLKDAIGQGHMYRLRYRFVFLILVIKDTKKEFYSDLCAGKEYLMEEMLQNLADQMNLFTYIVPCFSVKPGMKKLHSYFMPVNDLVE